MFFGYIFFLVFSVISAHNKCETHVQTLAEVAAFLRQKLFNALESSWNVSLSALNKVPLFVLETMTPASPNSLIGCPSNMVPFDGDSCTFGLDYVADIKGSCAEAGGMFDEVLRSCVKAASVEATAACPPGHRIAIKPAGVVKGPCIRDDILDGVPTCDSPFIYSETENTCLLYTYTEGDVGCRQGEILQNGQCTFAQHVPKTVNCPENYTPNRSNPNEVICERNVTYPGRWNTISNVPICDQEESSFKTNPVNFQNISLPAPVVMNVTCQKTVTAKPLSVMCGPDEIDYIQYMNQGNNVPVNFDASLGHPTWTCVRIQNGTQLPRCSKPDEAVFFEASPGILQSLINLLSPDNFTAAAASDSGVMNAFSNFTLVGDLSQFLETNSSTSAVTTQAVVTNAAAVSSPFLNQSFDINQPILISPMFQQSVQQTPAPSPVPQPVNLPPYFAQWTQLVTTTSSPPTSVSPQTTQPNINQFLFPAITFPTVPITFTRPQTSDLQYTTSSSSLTPRPSNFTVVPSDITAPPIRKTQSLPSSFMSQMQDFSSQIGGLLANQLTSSVSQILKMENITNPTIDVTNASASVFTSNFTASMFDRSNRVPFGQPLQNIDGTQLLRVDEIEAKLNSLNNTSVDWPSLYNSGELLIRCRTATSAKFYLSCPDGYKLRKDGSCKGYGSSLYDVTCPPNFALDELSLSLGKLRGQVPMCQGRLPIKTKFFCQFPRFPQSGNNQFVSVNRSDSTAIKNDTLRQPVTLNPAPIYNVNNNNSLQPQNSQSSTSDNSELRTQLINLIQSDPPTNNVFQFRDQITDFPKYNELADVLNDECILQHIALLANTSSYFTFNQTLLQPIQNFSALVDKLSLLIMNYTPESVNTPASPINNTQNSYPSLKNSTEDENDFIDLNNLVYVPVKNNETLTSENDINSYVDSEASWYFITETPPKSESNRNLVDYSRRRKPARQTYNTFSTPSVKSMFQPYSKEESKNKVMYNVFDLDIIYLRSLIFEISNPITVAHNIPPEFFQDEENRRCYISRNIPAIYIPSDQLVRTLYGDSAAMTYFNTLKRFNLAKGSPFLSIIPEIGTSVDTPQALLDFEALQQKSVLAN